LASNELSVQAFGLGDNGRNDLPGLSSEVFLSKYALAQVVLVHSFHFLVRLRLLRGAAIRVRSPGLADDTVAVRSNIRSGWTRKRDESVPRDEWRCYCSPAEAAVAPSRRSATAVIEVLRRLDMGQTYLLGFTRSPLHWRAAPHPAQRRCSPLEPRRG
jgi:hypothetical protein